MVKAAIRLYFRTGRDGTAALKRYDGAVAKAKRREKLATQFAKGRDASGHEKVPTHGHQEVPTPRLI